VVAFVLSPFLYMHSSLYIPCVSQVSSFMLQFVSIFQQHCCWNFCWWTFAATFNIIRHSCMLGFVLYVLFNAALVFSSPSHSVFLQRHNQNQGIFEW
jgi:hypothetical protein